MSHALTTACRPLQLPPTQKAVLMALADFANDAGECWPSIRAICEWTCYSERAVRNAIRQLESSGHVVCDASRGRNSNRYTITRNPAAGAPLTRQQVPPAGGAGLPNPAGDTELTRHMTTPTRQQVPPTRQQVPPNRKEPSLRATAKRTVKKSAPANAVARPDEVQEQVWIDWLALRKAKKAPVTETVLKQASAESAKAGLPLNRFLEIWCVRGSQGLQADWLKPQERGKPSAAASFHGKTYTGTPEHELPESLRPAH